MRTIMVPECAVIFHGELDTIITSMRGVYF